MPEYNFTVPQVQPVRQSSLADMLTIARGAQAYQQEQQMNPLELRAKQMAVEQAAAVNPLELRAKQMQVEQAGLMNPELYKAQVAATQTAQTGASSAELGFQNKKAQIAMDEATSVVQDPRVINAAQDPKAAIDAFIEARDRMIRRGVPKHDAEMHVAPWLIKAGQGSPTLRDDMQNAMAAGTGASGQQAQINYVAPTAGTLDTGAGILQTTGIPSSRGSQPTITAGAPIAQRELPPTTERTATPGDGTNLPPGTRYILGPQGPRVIGATAPAPAPIVTALAPSVASTLATSATAANDDWKQTMDKAQNAPQRIAIFQNIKKLAPESFTGVGGERKALVSGIAQAVGIPVYELEKTTTEELVKNTKLLALAGGNTDAARQLAEVANPNSKMTVAAIKNVADQMIGVERMNTARYNYLLPFREDPVNYQKKMAEFTPLMDYRIYQTDPDPVEFKKLINSMSDSDKADIKIKLELARKLGIIPTPKSGVTK